MSEIDERAEELTKRIYNGYGSGTGVLFGIPANLKDAVKAIIKATLQMGGNKNG